MLRSCRSLVLVLVLLVSGFYRSPAPASEPVRVEPAAAASPARVAELPATIDLRSTFQRLGLGPRVQGARPTCSVFTVTGALEFAAARHAGQCPRLSVEFLNWTANQVRGHEGDGGFFSDLWKGFEKYGICAEKEMPYQPRFEAGLHPNDSTLAEAKTRLAMGLRLHWVKEWDVNTGLTDAELTGIKRALARGWPVCAGSRWPKQERWADDVLQMCSADAVRDGHSVLLVGYRDDATQPGGGVFIFRNTSHDGRDGFMPYAYARQYVNDAAWVD